MKTKIIAAARARPMAALRMKWLEKTVEALPASVCDDAGACKDGCDSAGGTVPPPPAARPSVVAQLEDKPPSSNAKSAALEASLAGTAAVGGVTGESS